METKKVQYKREILPEHVEPMDRRLEELTGKPVRKGKAGVPREVKEEPGEVVRRALEAKKEKVLAAGGVVSASQLAGRGGPILKPGGKIA